MLINLVDMKSTVWIIMSMLLLSESFFLRQNHKYILFSVALIVGSILLSYSKKKNNIILGMTDIFWFCFWIFGFVSITWSSSIGTTLQVSLQWMCFIIWFVMIKHITTDKLLSQLQLFFSLLLIFNIAKIVLMVHLFGLSSEAEWRQYLGYNRNISVLLLVVLLPFFLSLESAFRYLNVAKMTVVTLVLYLIFLSNSFGNLIPFTIIAIVYVKLFSHKKSYIGPILFVFALVIIAYNFILQNPIGAELPNKMGRIRLITGSLNMFLHNSFTGVGLGNWIIEAPLYCVNNYEDNLFVFQNNLSHNLYAEILGELGGPGLLLFLGAIFASLYYALKGQLSKFELPFLLSVIVFLIAINYYKSSYSNYFYFSTIQLIAFTSFAVLAKNELKFHSFKWIPHPVLVAIIGLCLLGFLLQEKRIIEYESEINLLSGRNNKSDVRYTSKSKWNTLDYYGQNFYPTSLKFAELHKYSGQDNVLIEKYLKEAYDKLPFNKYVCLEIAKSGVRKENGIVDSEGIKQKLLSLYPKDLDVNIFLAELSLHEKKLVAAKEYLDRSYSPNVTELYSILELELYYSGYLEKKFSFSEIQKEELLNIRNRKSEMLSKNKELQPQLEKSYGQLAEEGDESILREIRKRLIREVKDQEKEFFLILGQDYFEKYIEDKSRKKVTHQVNTFQSSIKWESPSSQENFKSLLYDYLLEKTLIIAYSKMALDHRNFSDDLIVLQEQHFHELQKVLANNELEDYLEKVFQSEIGWLWKKHSQELDILKNKKNELLLIEISMEKKKYFLRSHSDSLSQARKLYEDSVERRLSKKEIEIYSKYFMKKSYHED